VKQEPISTPKKGRLLEIPYTKEGKWI